MSDNTFKTFGELALSIIADIEKVDSFNDLLTYLPRIISEVELGYGKFAGLPKKELAIQCMQALAVKFLNEDEQKMLSLFVQSGALSSLIDETVGLVNNLPKLVSGSNKKCFKFCCH
jgi:hypothetical protein